MAEPFDSLDGTLLNKVVSLKELWAGFEKLGEINVKISHHSVKRDGLDICVTPTGKLVFMLQRQKEPTTKDGESKKGGAAKKKAQKNAKKKKKNAKEEDSTHQCDDLSVAFGPWGLQVAGRL